MQDIDLITVVRNQATACQNSASEPHQNPDYRTPFYACHIVLTQLANELEQVACKPAEKESDAHWKKFSSDLPTLRDQFAMAALTGLIAQGIGTVNGTTTEMAYRIADEMLERRKP